MRRTVSDSLGFATEISALTFKMVIIRNGISLYYSIKIL